MRFSHLLLATLLLAGFSAVADDDVAPAEAHTPPKDFDAYQEANEMTCVGLPDGKQTAVMEYDVGGFHYAINGGHAKVTRLKARTHPDVRLGIVNAIKDATEETVANLNDYFKRFKAEDVDAILVGGDTAYGEDDIEAILKIVGANDVPVYAVIGNAETRAAWNRAARAAWQANHNIINVDLVRVVNGEGFSLVSLPGYHDKRFSSNVAPCLYTAEDVTALPEVLAGVTGPTVLLTHGPPRQTGKNAIDYTQQAGNVGDPDMAAALAKAKVAFGVFGHIVEAGGRATDASGKKEIKPLTLSDSLYLNPGSANSAPWRMNVGPASYGMAAVMWIDGTKAKYEILKSPQRVGKD
jgi:Icc-related predicted phosphoesterase